MSLSKKGTRAGRRKVIPVTLPKEYFKPCSTRFTVSAKTQPKSTKQVGRGRVSTNQLTDIEPKPALKTVHRKDTTELTSKWPTNNSNTLINKKEDVAQTSFRNKPKELATILSPKNYKIRPIIPATKKELIPVAKAMHREEFGTRVKNLFQLETHAALDAIDSGVYIGWRCPEYSWDCIRASKYSRCFCGHTLSEHAPYSSNSIRIKCLACCCKAFAFIPGRSEDIGEWWLKGRPGFDVSAWYAKCRCKHTHIQHDPNTRKCIVRGCACFVFDSNFLCAACDRHWEQHETYFESASTRKHKGLPFGEEYLPFYEMPDLRNISLTGDENNEDGYNNIMGGPAAIPRYYPSKLSQQFEENSAHKR